MTTTYAKKSNISTENKIILSVFCSANAFLYFKLYYVVPQFKAIFESFGSEIPIQTAVAISLVPVYLVLAFVSLFPVVNLLLKNSLFNRPALLLRAAIIFSIFSAIYFGFVLYAMYLPVFQLESVK